MLTNISWWSLQTDWRTGTQKQSCMW